MKIISIFHALVFLMAVLTFSMPFVTLAQENSTQARNVGEIHQVPVNLLAKAAAERDAATDANQLLWGGGTFGLAIVGGCLLGSVGLLGSYLYEPSPPASRLLGKSPEYILFYTEPYKAKVRNLRVRSSTLGCLGGSLVGGLLWFRYVANSVEY